MTVYILGGGPTGMAVADGLKDIGIDNFVVLEARDQLGGLAQTLEWSGVGAHDLGPHKVFSLDEKITARVKGLLPPDEWLKRDKKSSIYLSGTYLPYPPSPFSLLGIFGINTFVKMVVNYVLALLRNLLPKPDADSFESELSGRVGEPLYRVLFKPIAQKLWADPKLLDAKLARGRVQTPSPIEMVIRMLGLSDKSKFEALSFLYPKGGLQKIWSAIARKVVDQDRCFKTNSRVIGLNLAGNRLTGIRYESGVSGKVVECELGADDFVVSTLPLNQLPGIFGSDFDEDIISQIKANVRLNDLKLVFFHLDQEKLLAESWVFVPDSNIVFHRLSEQRAFDPEMTPSGTIVCCEVMEYEGKSKAYRDDVELIELCVSDLRKMGYQISAPLESRIIPLWKSYPVYIRGYEPALESILEHLDGFDNFRTLGRQGAFNYIGTLDAMDIGYGWVDWFEKGLADTRHNELWKCERQRTDHYPVLD